MEENACSVGAGARLGDGLVDQGRCDLFRAAKMGVGAAGDVGDEIANGALGRAQCRAAQGERQRRRERRPAQRSFVQRAARGFAETRFAERNIAVRRHAHLFGDQAAAAGAA